MQKARGSPVSCGAALGHHPTHGVGESYEAVVVSRSPFLHQGHHGDVQVRLILLVTLVGFQSGTVAPHVGHGIVEEGRLAEVVVVPLWRVPGPRARHNLSEQAGL